MEPYNFDADDVRRAWILSKMPKRVWPSLLSRLGFDAMYAVFVIFVREIKHLLDVDLINHELIHRAQNIELLFVGQWIIYFVHFSINLFKYDWDIQMAYRNVCFEREAYANEDDIWYLSKRPRWAWRKYW